MPSYLVGRPELGRADSMFYCPMCQDHHISNLTMPTCEYCEGYLGPDKWLRQYLLWLDKRHRAWEITGVVKREREHLAQKRHNILITQDKDTPVGQILYSELHKAGIEAERANQRLDFLETIPEEPEPVFDGEIIVMKVVWIDDQDRETHGLAFRDPTERSSWRFYTKAVGTDNVGTWDELVIHYFYRRDKYVQIWIEDPDAPIGWSLWFEHPPVELPDESSND